MRVSPLIACAALLVMAGPAFAQGRRGPDNAPAKGTPAPDFTLQRLEADGTTGKDTVKLSEVCKKQPVAIVFGSYT